MNSWGSIWTGSHEKNRKRPEFTAVSLSERLRTQIKEVLPHFVCKYWFDDRNINNHFSKYE